MKINITVEAEPCPYWDYDTHTRGHTCGSCECFWEGNTIDNAKYGVMVDGDRYCMLGVKLYSKIVESIEGDDS